ncbi:ABC transporter permease subunit [Risungbinella massiliensis]|uniref:ABC transporter permease subunit n=1 Tax=Risungbinella massiliensis TaxID=1329796 RepID=UPI0005CC3D75|nr:ABC transporter permease subunit [Risungbinella massiliensis]
MNKYLRIGISSTIGWVLLAIIGPWYLPEPVTSENIILQIDGQTDVAPIGPTEEYWFGRDIRGRNQLTLMLLGLKFTLLTVAIIGILRQVLGSALGIIVGMSKKPKSPIIQTGSSTFGFLGLLPAFLITYCSLLGFIGEEREIAPYIWTIFFIQVLILSLFGIAPIAARAQIQTYQICSQPYVEASKMLGASRFGVFRRHISPAIRDSFWLNCLSEMLLVLQLVGQLSLFYLFIGGTKYIPEGNEFLSISFEWLGLIGQNRDWFIIKPETVIVPVVSYLLLSTTLFFLQKGLEVRLKAKEQQMYGSLR